MIDFQKPSGCQDLGAGAGAGRVNSVPFGLGYATGPKNVLDKSPGANIWTHKLIIFLQNGNTSRTSATLSLKF